MTDPVIAADGRTYQRDNIKEWLSRGNTRSPFDGLILPNTNLIYNVFASDIIREFLSRFPEKIKQCKVSQY